MKELVYIDTAGNYGDARGLVILNLADIKNGEALFQEALDRGEPIRTFVYDHDWEVKALVLTDSTAIFSPKMEKGAGEAMQRYEESGGRA